MPITPYAARSAAWKSFDGSSTITPPAPAAGFPDRTTTGVPTGITLTPSNGITVTANGTVIDSLDITGEVVIKASNVVIKNSRINPGTTDFFAVNVNSGSVLMQDCELMESNAALVTGDNWTALRCNVHDAHGDGFKLGNNTTIQDCYIHDFATLSGQHADGAQLQDGLTNVLISGNYIDPSVVGDFGNAAVFIKNDFGPAAPGPIVVDGNLLGGGGFSLYVVDGSSGALQSGVAVTNNQFKSNAQFGSHAYDSDIPVTWSNNKWFDGPNVGTVIAL